MSQAIEARLAAPIGTETDSVGRSYSANNQSLETLSRPMLEMVLKLTGLDSAYLTEVRSALNEQEILFADNRGDIVIPEGLTVPWHDTLCRRALDSGRQSTANVPVDLPGSEAAQALGLQSYVSVPVRSASHELLGTLCGASGRSVAVTPEAADLMDLLAQLMADQWERDRARDAALQRAEAAEERLRNRATFLAVAEHKLKSPLALLRGWSDILATSWPELPADVRDEALHTMQDAARDAVRQVDELLLEARTEVQALSQQPVRLELAPLVAQVAGQLCGIVSDAHRVQVSRTLDVAVVADSESLWQVLWHLGENAVKYSPSGGLIDFSMELSDRDRVVVIINDEGIGVPDDVDVFAPFARGATVSHADIPGTGLGLHIVRNLAEVMQGTVTAHRRETSGSSFRLTLPVAF